MEYVPLEKCLDRSKNSVYKLTILAARRARELADGSKPLVDGFDKDKPLNTALEEILKGCIEAEEEK